MVGCRAKAFSTLANRIPEAGGIGVANMIRDALHEGIARAARRAAAGEASWSIGADGRKAALSIGSEGLAALVDVQARLAGTALEAFRTRAVESAHGVLAVGARAALAVQTVATAALVNVFAVSEWIAGEAGGAVAVVAAGHVGAERALPTKAGRPVAGVALVDVHTARGNVVRIEGEALVAHAGGLVSIVHLAVRVSATSDAITRRSTTQLSIANEAFLANALVTSVVVNALRVGAAWVLTRLTFIDIAALGSLRLLNLLIANLAFAFEATVRVEASRIGPADVSRLAFIHVCQKCVCFLGVLQQF